jgi:hypothetical protein
MTSLMFPPSQLAVDPQSKAIHRDLYAFLRGLSDVARRQHVPTKTAAYSAKPGEVVLCDPTGGGFTITLPRAAIAADRTVTVKNHSASANTITIDGHGSDTIDGAANTTITAARVSLELYCIGGTEWIVK